MDVRFTTADFGDEAASLAAAEAGKELSEEAHIFGHIVLEHAGQPTLSIYDDLPFLVQSLCVNAPASLRTSGTAEVRLVEWPNRLTLRGDGEDVHLTGEQGEAGRYPLEPFLTAAQACARRFATFLDAVAVTAPDFEDRAGWLRAALAE